MSNVKKIARNTSVLTAGIVATRVLEFITLLLLTRYLNMGDVGVYMAIFTYLGYCSTFIDFGMIHILRRESARDRDNYAAYMNNGLTISLGIAVFLIGCSYVILQISGYPGEVKSLFIYGAASVIVSSRFISFRKIVEVMFVVDMRVHYNVMFNLVDRILFLTCLVLIVRSSHSTMHAVFLAVAAESVGFVLLMGKYVKEFRFPRLTFNFTQWKFLMKESWPILLKNISLITISRGNILILTAFTAPSKVAVFGIASRIPFIINFIPSALTEPIFVVMSQKYKLNKEAFFEVFSIMMKYIMFLAFLTIILLIIEADELIMLFFSDSYLESIPIIKILLVAELFFWAYAGFTDGLIASNKQLVNFKILAVSAALAIVMNLVLIPRFGVMGAAYATLVSSGLFLVIALSQAQTRRYALIVIRSLYKTGLAGFTMGGILYYLDLNIWMSFMIGPIVYITVYIALKGITQRDLQMAYELYPHKFILRFLDKTE